MRTFLRLYTKSIFAAKISRAQQDYLLIKAACRKDISHAIDKYEYLITYSARAEANFFFFLPMKYYIYILHVFIITDAMNKSENRTAS